MKPVYKPQAEEYWLHLPLYWLWTVSCTMCRRSTKILWLCHCTALLACFCLFAAVGSLRKLFDTRLLFSKGFLTIKLKTSGRKLEISASRKIFLTHFWLLSSYICFEQWWYVLNPQIILNRGYFPSHVGLSLFSDLKKDIATYAT